ncbi:MAG: Ig-like domain-containing protein, partial [Casimicrobium sp.]
LALNADGSFVYTPSANLNGADTFTYQAVDGALQSPPVTVTINVTPVNDAPRFTVGPNQAVLPNASAQTISAWATGIDDGDPESTQALSFEITNNSNPTLFSVAPQVSATGVLTYTIAANQTGSATIELRLRDDGGTANGGVDVSATQSFVIVVDSAPSVTTATPAQGAIVANNQALNITFSEPINASAGAVTLTCGGANLITGGTSGSNVTTLTPTYAGTLPNGASCTLTVLASSISDVDTIDPPDTMSANFVRNFTVDAAPVQLSQIPGNGSTGVAVNATIGATFSEPVNATANAIEVQCRVGTDPPVNIALSGLPLSNVTTVTVTPVNPMPSGATCTVFVFGTRITDADTIDGPDEFVGSAWSFTTASLAAVNDAYNLAEDRTLFINASSGVLANDSPPGGNLNAVLVTAPTNG